MRNYIIAFFILVLIATSCGTQKAATKVKGPKVQTTFFGACLGESMASAERKIRRDYFLRYTNKRNEKEMHNVSFAGSEWPYALVASVESSSYGYRENTQLFSRIGFVYDSKDKKMVTERFNDIHQLLSEKYPLVRVYSSPRAEKEYAYTDSVGNYVALVLTRSVEDPDTWLCMLAYGWGKAEEVERNKARNDI